MKILALSDLHSEVSYFFINQVVSLQKPDIVIILGDITNFGPSENATNIFNLKNITI